MNIRAKPVETSDELKLANDLLAAVQADQEYPGRAALRWLQTAGVSYPGFKQEHTRIAVLKKEVAAGLRLNTDTIRLGEARLKMGGVGWVSTAEHHRHKGLCRLLMEDVLGYMREHGYHVSALFGIQNLYHKFGYVSTLADYNVVVDTMEALTFDNPFRTRPAKPGDIRTIQRIHHANDTHVACSLLRTAAHMSCTWDRFQRIHVLTDDRGKVIGYYAAEPNADHLGVKEVGVAEPGICPALLGATAKLAEEHALGHIRFHVPPSHALARYLLLFTSRHETRIARDAGGMMAVVDVAETLEVMVSEWENLLTRSSLSQLRTEFSLLVDKTPYRIRANHGAIDVATAAGKNKISVTPDELVHLLTGYRYPEDILDSRPCIVAPNARALFLALFPKRNPYIWPLDRF